VLNTSGRILPFSLIRCQSSSVTRIFTKSVNEELEDALSVFLSEEVSCLKIVKFSDTLTGVKGKIVLELVGKSGGR
jgi:hypothetical protein